MSLERTIVIRDRIYIPVKQIDADQAIEDFTHRFYEEHVCAKCDHLSERHSYLCDECPAFKQAVSLTKLKTVKGVQFLGFPLGSKKELPAVLDIRYKDFRVVDKRVSFPFDVKIKFTGKLRDYQVRAKSDWMLERYGLIEAPPRSGKTITALALLIELGQKVLFTANQKEFLDQFIEHIEEFTNLPELQEKLGKKLYGYPKTPQDFRTMQFACIPYQSFLSDGKGKKRLELASKYFGVVFVDEVHKTGATEFARFLSSLPLKYRGGMTATVKRKDGKHIISRQILGPVQHRVRRDMLVPKLVIHETDVKPRSEYRGPAGWTYAMQFLSKHKARNDLIVKHVVHDLKKGRSIVLPVLFKDHVKFLVGAINAEMGEAVAAPFMGGGGKQNVNHRRKVVEDARSGKIRVVVGIRSLLQLGINVPRWDTLYYALPMSNEPNWKQESSRILTPDDGKNEPLIRFFVDPNMGQSLGCFGNTWFQSLRFGHKPTAKAKERADRLVSNRKRRHYGMEEEAPPVQMDVGKRTVNRPGLFKGNKSR